MNIAVGLTQHDRDVRAKRIGASEVAAVLGLSPWAGPFDVWARIVHGVEKDESPEMAVGRYLESAVLGWYRDKTGHSVSRGGGMVHGEHDWLSATPDAWFIGPGCHGLVEAKTARDRDQWGADESDEVPVYYAAQCQAQMAVTGEARVDVPVLFTQSYQFGLYVVRRDDAVITLVLRQLGEWWQRHIVGGEMPALDGGSAAAEVLRRLYPAGNGVVAEATPEQVELARRYAEAKSLESDCADRAAVLRQKLIMEIGERDGLAMPDGGRWWFRADKAGRRSLRYSGPRK